MLDSPPHTLASSDARDRHRLIQRALLAYVIVIVIVLTLSPFRFTWPEIWRVSWAGDREDTPVNFLLFLPVGYFFRLALPRVCPQAVFYAWGAGTAFSLTIELLQLFLPARLTSVFDLLGNGLGAAAGAILCNAIRRRLDRTPPAVLALEHPLLNLVYLMLPLMWLSGVSIANEPEHIWLLAPLGVVGTLTLTGLWRYRFAGATPMPRLALALTIMAWFVFGGVTGLYDAPHIVVPCAAGIFVLSLCLLYVRGPYRGPERRFEHKVLIAIWPCYLLYLVMIVMWPMHAPLMSFDFTLGYPEYGFDRNFTLRIAEQLGALTLFGYLVAETFGRARVSTRMLVARNVAIGVGCALVLECLHGFLPGDRASLVRWLLGCAATAFGVMLYALQLNFVHVIRGHRDQPPAGQ